LTYRSLALLLPLALLAGCHKPAKNDQRSASGEVLQGTISDAMLPLDTLKSQPPLLAPSQQKSTPEGVEDAASAAEGVASETSADAGVNAEATPATASTPAPAPSGTP
jgi:hypothetical protein